jgi:predicted nucleic acid-binding protein
MERLIERVVLDSTVVSYIFNGDSRADYYQERIRGRQLLISFQTLEESWFGAFRRGWGASRTRELEAHLQQYETIWPDAEIATVCARLRAESLSAGRGLQIADSWIAATALTLGCPLASHDRDFDGIPGLEVIRST